MTTSNNLIRTVTHDERGTAVHNISSPTHVEPVMSNADLYVVTPPAYTQSVADGELSVDAEDAHVEKPEAYERSPERSAPSQPLLEHEIEYQTSHTSTSRRSPSHEERSSNVPRYSPVVPPLTASSSSSPFTGHYLTEPVATANLVGVRACSILQDRPAIWLVKRRKMALSPLAAAVLTKEGLIGAKELELISQQPGARRDPTDPLSGILFGVYDTVGEMMLGLVAGPVELGRQASPMMMRYESRQQHKLLGTTPPVTTGDIKGVPHAAAQVALGTGKGLGRIVTATLKSPIVLMNGVTRGFHNLPKAYGEEVRVYQNVTGIRSGLAVSAKSFGYGVSDGIQDLFTKPIEGADRNGLIGFGTGMAKGLGNAMFKPVAGASGLLSYPFVGVYKSLRNVVNSNKDDPVKLVRELGEEEYKQASDANKLYVVRVWCQTQMRVRLT